MTNFKNQKYYQDNPKFKGAYSQNNLPTTIKNRTYLVNVEENKSIGMHGIALRVKGNSVTYFDGFDVEHKYQNKYLQNTGL